MLQALKVTEHNFRVYLGLLLLFGALFQMVYSGHRWVDDESWYLMPLPSIYQEGQFRIPEVPGDDRFWPQPPLLTYLEAAWGKIVNLNASTARIIPIAFSLALGLMTGLLARALFASPLIGVIAAFYVLVDNILFVSARTVRPDIMVPFFIVLSLWYALRFQHDGRRFSLFWSALAAAGAIASHPNGLLAPCTTGLYLLMLNLNARGIKNSLLFAVFVLLLVTPLFFWVSYYDGANGYASFRSHWLGRYGRYSETGEQVSMFASIMSLVMTEVRGRYTDFIQFPFRVHIGVALVLGVLAAVFSRQVVLRILGLAVVGHLLFFIFVNNSNSSIRYMTSLLPLMAIIWAYFSAQIFNLDNKALKPALKYMLGLMLVGLIGGSQLAGNAYMLYKFRHADYHQVVTEIQQYLEPGDTIYGGMAFWLGLHDGHTFVPYMRMPWDRAVKEYQPDIVLMDDWVMMGGWVAGEWLPLRKQLLEVMKNQGTLLGEVNNPFYGDIKVYRVAY